MLGRGERKIKTQEVEISFLRLIHSMENKRMERERRKGGKKIFNKRENSRVMSLGDVFDLERERSWVKEKVRPNKDR